MNNATEFRAGLKAGTSIAIGYFPVAITFGLLSKTTGLTLTETIAMSLIVFAGAAQYMSLTFIAAGTSSLEIILTIFIVNIRHLLMSTSLNEKVEKDAWYKKSLYAYGITDESFSVASLQNGKISTGFMFGLTFIGYASWVVSSGIGYVGGSILPGFLQQSLSIALYAMFVGLLVPSIKGNKKVLYLAVVAALLNSTLTINEVVSAGWAIVIATLVSAVLIEVVAWMKRSEEVA